MALLGVYFRVEYLIEVFPSLWCFHMTKPALTAYAFYPPLVLLTMKISISSGPEPLLPACYLLSSSKSMLRDATRTSMWHALECLIFMLLCIISGRDAHNKGPSGNFHTNSSTRAVEYILRNQSKRRSSTFLYFPSFLRCPFQCAPFTVLGMP